MWISNPRGDIPGSEDVKTSLIFARSETIEKKRADVDALRAALTDALRNVQDDHAATGQTLRAKNFPELDPAVLGPGLEDGHGGLSLEPRVPARGLRLLDGERSEGPGQLQGRRLHKGDLCSGSVLVRRPRR